MKGSIKNLIKNLIILFLIFLIIAGVFGLIEKPFQKEEKLTITQLVSEINQEKIKEIKVKGDELFIIYLDDKKAISRKEANSTLYENLTNYGAEEERLQKVKIEIAKAEEGSSLWITFLVLGLLPLLIFGIFFWIIFRRAKGGASEAFSFLKAPIKLYGAGGKAKEKVTFKDIAGLEEAKEEIKEVVDFLKNPKKFLKIGARIPRGVLLIGAPGTGKTLMARAVANEANVPFFSISGSEFIELFVGVGASRVRSLFDTAKKNQSSIVFIDEIDAIGRTRGFGIGGGHEEREQTLNQILSEMDGFTKETGIIVIGATNKPEILDPALLRPGRFDRRIILDLPDIKGREGVLKIHCRGKPLALDVNLREIAERTAGFSGADLANLVNEAAILAGRRNQETIYQKEFLESIEKVLLGPERKSHLLSKKERKIAAYHEAGHALVSTSIPDAVPIRKVSIISRGLAAGYTLAQPKEEKRIKTKSEFLTEIAVLLGGYCAEKIKFGQISTGAANDLEKATEISQRLVKEYGMSKLGPITYGKRERAVFLQEEIETRDYSEKIASEIDKEVRRFIKEAELKATKILTKRKRIFEKIAKTLIEKESIEKEEFERLVKGKKSKVSRKPLKKKKKVLKVKIKRP